MDAMTKQEAEAALMALGAGLVWSPYPANLQEPGALVSDQWYGTGGRCLYQVFRFLNSADQQRPYRADCWQPQREVGTRRYRSLHEAKRACDMHAICGKWE